MSALSALRGLALVLGLSVVTASSLQAQRKQAPTIPVYRGFYYGLSAGGDLPNGDFGNSYGTGWHLQVPFGWDYRHLPVERAHSQGIFGDSTEYVQGRNPSSEDDVHPGIRLELGYTHLPGKATTPINASDIGIYMANADFKARKSFGEAPANHVYAMVGGTLSRAVAGTGAGLTSNGFATSFSDAPTSFGFNAGGGISLQAGERSTWFLESRFFNLGTKSSPSRLLSPRFVTITLGVTSF